MSILPLSLSLQLSPATSRAKFISPDPELFLKFEDDWLDSSGNGHHQTNNLEGDPTFTDGQVNRAAVFDGDDAINTGVREFGNVTLFPDATTKFTVACWAKSRTNTTARQCLVGKWSDSPIARDFYLSIDGDSGTPPLRFMIKTRDSATQLFGPRFSSGEWHHVAVVWNGSEMRLFVDGNFITTHTIGTAAKSDPTIRFARQNFNPEYLDGQMDELRLYDTALTDEQVATIAA